MRNILVAGNWKMNGDTAANAELVAGIIAGAPESDRVELLVCPPFPYLAPAVGQLSGTRVSVGAQTVSEHAGGAFTGLANPRMGARGQRERRERKPQRPDD